MKIVVYGLAKSGTSALFYKLKNSLPAGTIALFEPASYGPLERLRERLRALRRGRLAPDVLAKVLPCDSAPVRVEDFDDFDLQLLIVRDPRDRLVSDLLYRSYNSAFVRIETAALDFLALLRRKEADALSVPLLDLLRRFDALERGAGSSWSWLRQYRDRGVVQALRFHDERPQLTVFRYEELVEGRFDAVEHRLGLALRGPAEVPDALHRVVRTKSYGGWRSWFTPADVETFRPVLQPYLDRYYPDARWELGAPAPIEPGHGSLYVERVMNERRALCGLRPLPAEAR